MPPNLVMFHCYQCCISPFAQLSMLHGSFRKTIHHKLYIPYKWVWWELPVSLGRTVRVGCAGSSPRSPLRSVRVGCILWELSVSPMKSVRIGDNYWDLSRDNARCQTSNDEAEKALRRHDKSTTLP